MLIEFHIANFKSIGREQILSLVAGNDANHPENLIPCENSRLLKSAAIYGANASGKSNIIKAIRAAKTFIRLSSTRMNQGDRIRFASPFRLDRDLKQSPSSFAMVFVLDDTRYEYGFEATSKRVIKEWLFAYPPPHRKRQAWLERKFDAANSRHTDWRLRGPLLRYKHDLRTKTRPNGLALALGAELNVPTLAKIFLFCKTRIKVYDFSDDPNRLIQITAKRLQRDPDFRARVLRLLRDADLGIQEVSARQAASTIPVIAAGHASDDLPDAEFQVKTTHVAQPGGETEVFTIDEESNGTRRFFAIAEPFLKSLDTGSTLIVDELECSMHPLLTRRLIELFQNAQTNKKGAQLIFATHDSTLMDPQLFRRDQLWLVEKNAGGESILKSLHDFKSDDRPRSTEVFQRNYLAGKYGGIPKFGPTFEDLEIK